MVQRFGQAFQSNWTTRAHQLCPFLIRCLRKQGILHASALGAQGPVIPPMPCSHLLLSPCEALPRLCRASPALLAQLKCNVTNPSGPLTSPAAHMFACL